jgi:carbonic anhydrase/acetyltransferase-like protein (isoleucine patch superfamily)
MDGAVVHSNSVIAAGAVVLENMVVEAGSVYAGVPAKKVKDIDQDLITGKIDRIANSYLMYASWYKDQHEKSTQ